MEALLAVGSYLSSWLDDFTPTVPGNLCPSDVLKLEKGSRNIRDGMEEVAEAARDVSDRVVKAAELVNNGLGSFWVGAISTVVIMHFCQVRKDKMNHKYGLERAKHTLFAELLVRNDLPKIPPAPSVSVQELFEHAKVHTKYMYPMFFSCDTTSSRAMEPVGGLRDLIEEIKVDTRPKTKTASSQKQSHQKFSAGALVRVSGDVERVRSSAEGHGGWARRMKRWCGKVGQVLTCMEDGDVIVAFAGETTFVYNPAVLEEVHRQLMAPGTRVRVNSDAKFVQRSASDYGGWNPQMKDYCGSVGSVISDTLDGVRVHFRDDRFWTYNPEVLEILSE